ncbi:MAG TPA: hypothetical protein VIL57_03265, partial [Bacteroidia bacterium]
MEDISITYILASIHFLIFVLALLFTLRPIITLFHVILAQWTFAFAIRPTLSAFHNGVTLYPVHLS